MHQLIEIYRELIKPEWIMAHGGLYVVMFIIFAETGLFVGFFLPGDSLLFVTGVIIANSLTKFGNVYVDLLYWISLITFAGVIGNIIGYWYGSKFGHILMKWPDSMLFKKKYIHQAHDFYEKKGGMAIFFARFLPIVRTFAPIVGGMVDMNYKKFVYYNILGCLAWVISMIMAGFLLGNITWVQKNLEVIVIGLVIVTTGPVLFKMFFGKKKATTEA
ncbi:alkaline phosphatase [Flavipsychrobacter stenotrophus]|uniref:Alkaline phosphatase n=1 Tax=Flavipsychrobacter stenotrophus TaxID=2077091 RepID=A0A2S7T0Y5_9BACT|nr:VTT domain-containing protein [Flavipsychrobacter stenotrophus]PQJ12416.1 alkaline phosphatase [Flavipsychrobacter stenotrophus]